MRVIHLSGHGRPLLLRVRPRRADAGAEQARASGSIHRRMHGHVNRLIPAMLDHPDADRVHRAGLGDRPRPRPRARVRLRDRGRRRPAVGAVHHVRASRPTAARRGSSPASPAWPGPRTCCCSATKVTGADAADVGARAPTPCPAADLDAAGEALVGRLAAGADGRRRADEAAHAPRPHRRPRPAPRRRGLGHGGVEPLRRLQGVRPSRPREARPDFEGR